MTNAAVQSNSGFMPPVPIPGTPANPFEELPVRDRLARDIDQFWLSARNSSPLAALNFIEKTVVPPDTSGPETDAIVDAIETSTRILRFLHSGYLNSLSRHFEAVFLIGSMSYGRFYSVQSRRKPASDLDLFLVARTCDIQIGSLLYEDQLADDIDRCDRLQTFSRMNADPTLARFLNYKLRHPRDGFNLSLTICTLADLRLLLQPGRASPTVLHWGGSLDGLPNIQFDLARRPLFFPYLEHCLEHENRLFMPSIHTQPVREAVPCIAYNGLANMLLPRIEMLFASSPVIQHTRKFLRAMASLADQLERAGLPAELCNAHVRACNFPPALTACLNQSFRHFRVRERELGVRSLGSGPINRLEAGLPA
jgi:hypothetical protein